MSTVIYFNKSEAKIIHSYYIKCESGMKRNSNAVPTPIYPIKNIHDNSEIMAWHVYEFSETIKMELQQSILFH